MPNYIVTTHVVHRVVADNFNAAAELSEAVVRGDMPLPDSDSLRDVRVFRVEAV